MSLTMDAPAMIAASITDGFLVSMLIGTPNPTTSFITGITRSISSLAVTEQRQVYLIHRQYLLCPLQLL